MRHWKKEEWRFAITVFVCSFLFGIIFAACTAAYRTPY